MSAEFSASSVSRTVIGVDTAGALERVLYRCAKQDRDRRRHALVDTSPAATSSRGAPASLAPEATAAYASR